MKRKKKWTSEENKKQREMNGMQETNGGSWKSKKENLNIVKAKMNKKKIWMTEKKWGKKTQIKRNAKIMEANWKQIERKQRKEMKTKKLNIFCFYVFSPFFFRLYKKIKKKKKKWNRWKRKECLSIVLKIVR